MNVEGTAVELGLGRAIMPRFHAGFSVGTVAGALVGSAMVALGVSATVHVLAVAVSWPSSDRPPCGASCSGARAEEHGEARSPLRAWTEPRTLLIGLFVFAAPSRRARATTGSASP